MLEAYLVIANNVPVLHDFTSETAVFMASSDFQSFKDMILSKLSHS